MAIPAVKNPSEMRTILLNQTGALSFPVIHRNICLCRRKIQMG